MSCVALSFTRRKCVQGNVTLRVDLAAVADVTDRLFPWEEGTKKGLCSVAVEELKKLIDRVGAGEQYRTVLGM